MHSFLYLFFLASAVSAFVPLGQFATISVRPTTPLARGSVAVQMGRGNLRDDKESKRQSRVSQLMRGEIAQFVRLGSSIKTNDPLPDTLRERISVVDVHMSPDLRSAKVNHMPMYIHATTVSRLALGFAIVIGICSYLTLLTFVGFTGGYPSRHHSCANLRSYFAIAGVCVSVRISGRETAVLCLAGCARSSI